MLTDRASLLMILKCPLLTLKIQLAMIQTTTGPQHRWQPSPPMDAAKTVGLTAVKTNQEAIELSLINRHMPYHSLLMAAIHQPISLQVNRPYATNNKLIWLKLLKARYLKRKIRMSPWHFKTKTQILLKPKKHKSLIINHSLSQTKKTNRLLWAIITNRKPKLNLQRHQLLIQLLNTTTISLKNSSSKWLPTTTSKTRRFKRDNSKTILVQILKL